MNHQVVMQAQYRDKETPRALRRSGKLPGVLYGHKTDNKSIQVPEHQFASLLARGELHSPFRLEIEGDTSHMVMLKDVQRHPARGTLLHVDFLSVDMDQKVAANAPLRIEGEANATKTGGILQYQLREVHVECLPANLPDSILVDIGDLGIGDTLTVGQIVPPQGVTITDDPDSIILTITQPRLREAEEEKAGEPGESAQDKAEQE